MSEMMDRIAAIIQDWREDGGSSSGCARAVLEAMKEPTSAMLDELDTNNGGWAGRQDAKEIWNSLIETALK